MTTGMAAATTFAALSFRAPNPVSPPNKLSIKSYTLIVPSSSTTQGILFRRTHEHQRVTKKMARSAGGSPPSGLSAASQFELTAQKVDMVLEEVRPYLIADGGNVDVVSVEEGVVSLKLQGACGSCPSSSTTMTMGIERVLKEKFGDAVKEIRQVVDDDEQLNEITAEEVNSHLEVLRPAIKNYGGSVQVLSVEGGDCVVKYEGPESIGSGVKAAIKERFPAIVNVIFAD